MRWFRLLPVLVILAFAGSAPASAQELGLLFLGGSSGHPELPGPQGFGVMGRAELGGWKLGLAYVRYTDDTAKGGTVCEVYSPRIGCGPEPVTTTARMGGLRATVLRTLALGDLLEIGAGGGVSFNTLSATSVGVSGRRGDLFVPNTGQLGYLGTVSVSLAPLRGKPLRVLAGLSQHRVNFNGCVDPTDPTSGYAPFCGWDSLTEFHVGLSVVIPRP